MKSLFLVLLTAGMARAAICPFASISTVIVNGKTYRQEDRNLQFADIPFIDTRQLRSELLPDGRAVWYCEDKHGRRFDVLLTGSERLPGFVLFQVPPGPKLPIPKELR